MSDFRITIMLTLSNEKYRRVYCILLIDQFSNATIDDIGIFNAN